ncbi:YceH family protein [soil metagenome]
MEDEAADDLTPEEARVLGCLLEKEMATPEYYPMTANALQAACNQKTSRDPIMAMGSDEVEAAVEGLRVQKLAAHISMAGSRVPKFKHTLDREFGALERPHLALLAVLLLRGRQSGAELRSRCERLYRFSDQDAADAALDNLVAYEKRPLARRIPPGGGHRTTTYVSLLCGEDTGAEAAPGPEATRDAPTGGGAAMRRVDERLDALEQEVAALKNEVDALREALGG